MPRDETEQRRQQIIDGALDAFARLGFDRATNRDIARAAGIASPGLIYHYFKDKTDLLYQVIRERMPLVPIVDAVEQLGDEPPDVVLPRLGERLAQAIDQPLTVAIGKIVIGEVLRHPQLARVINEIGPGRAMNALAAYLARQMELGRLRRTDPQIAARLLIGPILTYFFSREVLDQPEAHAIAAHAMVAEAIAHFLRSMMVEESRTGA
ncbi:TetR/AcrR family transcriptional regulator [Chloroflexus aggregans]|uniref:Transcriptional regulator, TetR family n=1 Tax=Chloroflexus aggregans (strain MD-66 / DSM 9485) TaxID=326427 RepID=B8G591_CHLAD|nr:TetR/AcrR family transcriptional regulator [Chloroflexus aggregans]ACL25597.1 transcriptional regulator, TetR family [Chloroflexus aggregans DSM 9485]